MNARIEDLLGKSLLLFSFGWFLLVKSLVVIDLLSSPGQPEGLIADLTNQWLSLLFVAMIIALTIRRLPPRTSASGWEPRAVAIAGTFTLTLLLWVPGGAPGSLVLSISNFLLIIGGIGSLWSLHFLGRSFAVMAAARELVTGGPYGLVRHPLYLFEGLVAVGIILAHWNPLALLVGAVHFGFQFRRMQHEERVLRASFADYDAYASRVPMILPRLRPAASAAV
jgi:protein-S-isoprenylcysteine O-methyltransferase Ste14